MKNLKFSIIVPHYDGVISDEIFIEGMKSLDESTFRDFEVLIYHDGPVSRPIPDLSEFSFTYKYRETKTRYNDWGHSLRDLGIKEASGDYIIHFNPDNLLYPDAMFNIHKSIVRLNELFGGYVDIIICPIIMQGMVRVNSKEALKVSLHRTYDNRDTLVMDGYPPMPLNIDCMQLVGKRSMWLSQGGWYNKEETSDGLIYQDLCNKHSYTTCGNLIGEHR